MGTTTTNIPINDQISQQIRGNWKTAELIPSTSAGAGDDVVGASEDVRLYTYMSFAVEASGNCTFTYQVSYDDTNWFDPVKFQIGDITSVGDKTEGYKVDSEKRLIAVDPRHTPLYIRPVIHATAASTVKATLIART